MTQEYPSNRQLSERIAALEARVEALELEIREAARAAVRLPPSFRELFEDQTRASAAQAEVSKRQRAELEKLPPMLGGADPAD